MKDENIYDGVLQNWFVMDERVHGQIYLDRKYRFMTGEKIRTSSIKKIEGDVLHTQNSTYLLGKPAVAKS